MKTIVRCAFAAALLLGTSVAALAVERGGTLTYGRYADSLFLDPVLNDANVDIWILSNLYDTLLQPTDDGTGVRAGLATDWTLSADGKTVTLTLREDIKFSDGSPITGEDVVWSLDRARNPANGIWNFMLASIDKVAAEGNTVTLSLKTTDPTIFAALTVFNSAIMPKTPFEAAAGATDAEKAQNFAQKPIGSGPFQFVSWDRGATMKLAKNPYYWDKGEDGQPLPYLDGIDFEVIPDDATRILRLQSGGLDGAELIPFARVAELKAADGIAMELFPSTRVQYLDLNVRPEVNGKPNPFSNEKVRQALNYATDKDAIIQIVTFGVGTPMTSFMASTTPLHAGDAPLFPYDLDKAKALMAEAGFAKGFDASMLVLAGSQDEIGIATAVQQMWAAIGVKLTLQQVDNASRTDQYRNGTFPARVSAWTNDISDPSQITSYFAYSPTIDALHSSWKNEEVDKLFVASQSEADPKARAEQYAKIQEIYNATGPIVPLFETPYPVALRDMVHGFLQIPLGNNIFTRAWKEQ